MRRAEELCAHLVIHQKVIFERKEASDSGQGFYKRGFSFSPFSPAEEKYLLWKYVINSRIFIITFWQTTVVRHSSCRKRTDHRNFLSFPFVGFTLCYPGSAQF